MPIDMQDSLKIKAGKPVEPKSFYTDNKAYLNTAQVLATVPVAERHEYLPVNVAGVQYWFLPDLVTLVKIPSNITVDVPLTFINGVVSLSYDPLTLEVQNSKIQVKHGVYPELDAQGKVPAANLPGVIPDVIEVANYAALPAVGVSAVIYITIDDLKQYRWGGSVYALLSASLVLGDLSSNAYPGNKGKIAYDHTFNNTTNPHNVTKSQVGLANADNTSDANKPVSIAQQAALDLKSDKTHRHTIAQVDLLTEELAKRVVGPEGSANNVICIFDGTTGKLIKVTNVTIDANGQMVINAQGVGLTSIADYLGLEAVGGTFGLSGISPNVPLQLANSSTATTGRRRGVVLRGDSAHVQADPGYAIDIEWRLPCLGWDPAHPELSEIPGGYISCILTDNTQFGERSDFQYWLQDGGILKHVATLTSKGQFQINSLKLIPRATPPENPTGGEMYHNTNGHVYKFNAQSLVWDDMTATTGAPGVEVALTSNDNSVIIDKYDLSVNNQQVVAVGPGLQQGFGLYYNGHVAKKKYINIDGLVIGDAVCAENWHISTPADWTDLLTKCGGDTVAAPKLRQAGNLTWFPEAPAAPSTDEFGFTALPAGERGPVSGNFISKGDSVSYWSANPAGDNSALKTYQLEHANNLVFIYSNTPLTAGFSLRAVKNFTTLTVQGQKGEYIGNDGKKYISILIGTKEWLTADLAETKWRDGTLIPVHAGVSNWQDHTAAVLCAYNDNFSYITSGATQSTVGPKETLKFVGGENINVVQKRTPGVLEVVIDYNGEYASVNSSTPENPILDADHFGFWDTLHGFWSKITFANLKSTLETYFNTKYLSKNNIQYDALLPYEGNGYINKSGLNAGPLDANWLRTDFRSISVGKIVTCDLFGHTAINSISFYDTNKQYISGDGTGINNTPFIKVVSAPAGAAYFRLSMGNPATMAGGYVNKAYTEEGVVSLINSLKFEVLQKANTSDIETLAPYRRMRKINLTGKKVQLYGDSISSYDYTGYKDAMEALTGATVRNDGFSGATTALLASNDYLQRIFNWSADVIIILVGGNDTGQVVGTFGKIKGESIVPETNILIDYNGTYYIQAVSHIIRKVNDYYYDIKARAALTGLETEAEKQIKIDAVVKPYIVFCTTLPQQRNNSSDLYSISTNWKRKRDAVAECCEKYKVHCVDLYKLTGIDMTKEPFWTSPTDKLTNRGIYTMDGLHPNKYGYELISSIICGEAGLSK